MVPDVKTSKKWWESKAIWSGISMILTAAGKLFPSNPEVQAVLNFLLAVEGAFAAIFIRTGDLPIK